MAAGATDEILKDALGIFGDEAGVEVIGQHVQVQAAGGAMSGSDGALDVGGHVAEGFGNPRVEIYALRCHTPPSSSYIEVAKRGVLKMEVVDIQHCAYGGLSHQARGKNDTCGSTRQFHVMEIKQTEDIF